MEQVYKEGTTGAWNRRPSIPAEVDESARGEENRREIKMQGNKDEKRKDRGVLQNHADCIVVYT